MHLRKERVVVLSSSTMQMMVVRAGIHFQHALINYSVSLSLFFSRFHLAASRGHLDCLNLILNHGVDITATDATGEDVALDECALLWITREHT